jgi:serine/threonine protein kinase
MPERAVALIAYEVLKVVAACHAINVLHGDIKPANFVLRHRQRNPLVSGDLTYLFTPWLAAIDLGCSQYLGPEVRGSVPGRGAGVSPVWAGAAGVASRSRSTASRALAHPPSASSRPPDSSLLAPPQRFSKRTGTPVYMAPEIFERDYYVEADM